MSRIHPTAVVGPGVELGERVSVGPHAVLLGPCSVGDDCVIGAGCVVGPPPEIVSAEQNLAWAGELCHQGVRIGPRTVIRELTTVHQGSGGPTVIGADCWLLNRVYVAHDCDVGDGVTLSGGASLGGWVAIGRSAVLGLNVAVHQRRVIGPGAMVGMSSAVTRDVPPFAKAYGNPVRVHALNDVVLRQRGADQDELGGVLDAYRSGRAPVAIPSALAADFAWWAAHQ